jgi:transposase InsO family protein
VGCRYAPAERRRLLEAFARSGMRVSVFCKTVGVAPQTLGAWKRRYEAEGPKGLELRGLGRPKGSGAGSTLPGPVKEAITATKRRFPTFGLRKVKDYLSRFLGLRVSEGGVAKVIRETPDIPAPVAPKRKQRRRHAIVRTFERARPGALWQTDITSFLLRRHHRRVFLTVFLDDHSRFIAAWALKSQARSDLVTDCVLDGIQKYGKPVEVLTDQGPQYFSWRGKSRFQKLLVKEGIKHVVARSHHPQTVGKTERLWKTIAAEFWDRAHPEELEEARERLGHWVSFYNFFRPHQSLKGMTPADRFFGHEEAVAKAVKARIDENTLRLAIGEKPRKTVFMVGQVGDRAFSMHGEQGRVVLQTEDGVHEVMQLEDLGLTKSKETSHEEGGKGAGGHDGAGADGDGPDGGTPGAGEPDADDPDAGEPDGDDTDGDDPDDGAPGGVRAGGPDGGGGGEGTGSAAVSATAADADGASGGGGAGPVGPGERGGAGEGARGGHGHPGVVAGGAAQGGGAGAAAGDAAAPVADVADGRVGDGGGPAQAAEEEGEGAAGDSRGGGPGGAEEEGGAAGARPQGGAGAGGPDADAARVEDVAGSGSAAGEEGCQSARPSSSGNGSR